jgi:hypothetical protein
MDKITRAKRAGSIAQTVDYLPEFKLQYHHKKKKKKKVMSHVLWYMPIITC